MKKSFLAYSKAIYVSLNARIFLNYKSNKNKCEVSISDFLQDVCVCVRWRGWEMLETFLFFLKHRVVESLSENVSHFKETWKVYHDDDYPK